MAKKTTTTLPHVPRLLQQHRLQLAGGEMWGAHFPGGQLGETDDFEIRLEAGNDDPFLFWTGGDRSRGSQPCQAVPSFHFQAQAGRQAGQARPIPAIALVRTIGRCHQSCYCTRAVSSVTQS